MIAVCPKCSARYRVDTTRVGPEGARLRCAQCSALFLVRIPQAVATPAAVPAPAAREAVPSASPAASGPLVLIADADESRGKASLETIRSWGLAARLVSDGVEAMLWIQRLLPRAVVLDRALERMTGPEISEIVKRNESLKSTLVVLAEPASEASRDGRNAEGGFGPDACLDPLDLPDGLWSIFARHGLVRGDLPRTERNLRPSVPAAPAATAARSATVAPVPTAVSAPSATGRPPGVADASVRTPAPVASASAATDPTRDEERERARRLARIAVSEMLLYQPEKFAQACRNGTLERALEVEIQEARALIRQRIGPEVRAEADFVLDELHRVARERGAVA